ncbi:MAG: hypothetical protein CL843_02745 [Crocinitomicaceae bacterium]|nr:hypothetical protein [Crocinitomicaceae bacterium]|tara:strand:+ start:1224 stop:1877 length:654 start_codon:yes stop_codon:yes gene_type:complete
MPKQTFLNLPEEKRSNFVNTALKEFALNDYQNASVTSIVRELGIAKGSVYQYFENKKDLYFYLIELAGNRKLEATGELLASPGDDFFKWYRKLHVSSLVYDIQYPVEGALLRNVSREENNEDIGNMALHNKQEAISFYKHVLKQHYNSGLMHTKPNYSAFSYVLVQTGLGLMDLLQIQFGFSLYECAKTNTSPDVSEEEVKALVKKVVKSVQQNFLD